ncbi:MAG: hypothetical protein ACRC3G_08095 [Bacteroidales bacterium]
MTKILIIILQCQKLVDKFWRVIKLLYLCGVENLLVSFAEDKGRENLIINDDK